MHSSRRLDGDGWTIEETNCPKSCSGPGIPHLRRTRMISLDDQETLRGVYLENGGLNELFEEGFATGVWTDLWSLFKLEREKALPDWASEPKVIAHHLLVKKGYQWNEENKCFQGIDDMTYKKVLIQARYLRSSPLYFYVSLPKSPFVHLGAQEFINSLGYEFWVDKMGAREKKESLDFNADLLGRGFSGRTIVRSSVQVPLDSERGSEFFDRFIEQSTQQVMEARGNLVTGEYPKIRREVVAAFGRRGIDYFRQPAEERQPLNDYNPLKSYL